MRPTTVLLFAIIIIGGGCDIKKISPTKGSTDFDKANAFYYYDKLDSAFYRYNQYVMDADDVFKKAIAYRYMGDILWSVGDVYDAEESATEAIKILDTKNPQHSTELGYVYNLLGNVRLELQQYDDAINMFDQATRFSIDSNTNFVFETLNNKALAFQKKGNYNAAISAYDSMLVLKPTDSAVFTKILHNRARTKWLLNKNYPALSEFWQVLRIRTANQDTRGLNASYAHLSDYYENANPDSALWYANKMLQQAQIIQSPADRIEALDKIIRLENPNTVKNWYVELKRLNDSLQLARDTTKNIYAFIKYDSQKSKADSLVFKERVTTQRLWMFGLALFALAFIAWLWNRYNKRRKHIKLEAEQAIRQSKLKTSQKVHDVVANGLYVIMNELEHGKIIEKNELITRIEGLYEKSRNISYEDDAAVNTPSYDQQIRQLLTSFASEQTKVVIVGNEPAFWKRVGNVQKQELELILKELMVNMKKHSQAKNVAIVFKQEDNKGFINYTDDGIGFNTDPRFGNGLNNTVNRIKSLNGEVNFGKSGNGGAAVAISFPLQSSKT